jgi:hypothetical protein
MDLADINDVSLFSEQLDSPFRIEVSADQHVFARLVKAETLRPISGDNVSNGRDPFSLLFEVESSLDLPQRTYPVHHEQLGELALFLVPVGPGKLESYFN